MAKESFKASVGSGVLSLDNRDKCRGSKRNRLLSDNSAHVGDLIYVCS